MTDFKKLNIEYKAAAVFGVCSFFLSIVISIFSGNTAGLILFRSVIFAVIFCTLGFASLYVMKRYVPEIYEVFSSGIFGPGAGTGTAAEEEMIAAEMNGGPDQDSTDIKVEEDDMMPPAADSKDNIETEADLGAINNASRANTSDKEYEKMFKYEPEIAAQAIRTMMKKDEK